MTAMEGLVTPLLQMIHSQITQAPAATTTQLTPLLLAPMRGNASRQIAQATIQCTEENKDEDNKMQ